MEIKCKNGILPLDTPVRIRYDYTNREHDVVFSIIGGNLIMASNDPTIRDRSHDNRHPYYKYGWNHGPVSGPYCRNQIAKTITMANNWGPVILKGKSNAS